MAAFWWFNFGSLRVELCPRDVAFMFATVAADRNRLNVIDQAKTVGEAFGRGFGRLKWQIHVK